MGSSAYERAFEGLNDAQKRAVTTIEGPVLVIAGPGTGKTQLLTTRIAHILRITDSLPQNVLCLTFTDSGARTMRERLVGMIGQAAYDVTISTYHAFGSDLIRRFPDYFGEAGDLEPADDLAMDRILRTIVGKLPHNSPLKYADNYLRDIRTLISDAKRALLSPDDVRTVAKGNIAFIQKTNPLVSDTLGQIVRIDKKSISSFRSLLTAVSDAKTKQPRSFPVQPLQELLVTSLDEAVSAAEESGKTTPLTAWKNKWLAKDTDGRFILDGVKANQKLLAAADVYEAYLRVLQEEKLFDYDDMILRAVRTLEANADLRYTLQEQYLYILLDEFQDTNGAQLRLVELLTDNPVHEGRPNVLAVGDDDQAIYAFQGADYSHMLKFRDMYRDVLAVPLVENYRSDDIILHTAHGIAEQIGERLHKHFPNIDKTLIARASSADKPIVERREAESDIMQYAWVTKQIRTLIASGVSAADIAVLAPQHKYLEPLIPFLQEAQVPMRYEKRENVLDDPQIVELLRMSELVLALAKSSTSAANALWPQVISFAFWGLPTSTIWKLNWQHTDSGTDWTTTLLNDELLKPIALFFIRLSQIASSEMLENVFDYLIGSTPLDLHEPGNEPYTSPFYAHYFGNQLTLISESADFWNLLSNLIVLRARLREYHSGDEPLHLDDFIIFVEAMRAAELKILNTSPYATGEDSVSLMTAFKAKGMEWKAVFVLAVNDDAWGGKSHSASVRISLPSNLQFIRYAGATNDERLRLFYVAVTRAKSQLYLVNYRNNFAGRSMSRLKFLDESPDEQGTVQSPMLPEGHQVVLPVEEGHVAPTAELQAYWQQRHELGLREPALKSLLTERLHHYQLSPTHLNDFIDLVHSGPQAFFIKTILRFPQAPTLEIQFGNAMHETLEWLHRAFKEKGQLPTEAQLFATFEKKLTAKELSTQQREQYLARGQDALRIYLAERGSSIHATDRVEYNFRNEGAFIGKAHLSGKIDKLIINPKTKEIVIVDYKTGKSHTKWTKEVKLHKYRQQLYLYRALVEGSHTFAGYTVTDAYLEFVEPDESGHIQELHLEFNKEEYRAVRTLAEVIWERITSLDLPDCSGYTKDMQGIASFEEDLRDKGATLP